MKHSLVYKLSAAALALAALVLMGHGPTDMRMHLGHPQVVPPKRDTLVELDVADWDGARDGYPFTARRPGAYLACAGATYTKPTRGRIYSVQVIQYDAAGRVTERRAYGIAHANSRLHLTVTVCDEFHLERGESLKMVVWHNGRPTPLEPGYRRTWLTIYELGRRR